MRIGILEPDNFSKEAIRRLREKGKVSLFRGGDPVKFIKDKEALFVRFGHYIGKEILRSAKQLKYICSPTTGLNHIDMREARAMGIEVISLKNEAVFLSTVRAAPEHAFGLVLALLRNYKDTFLSARNAGWDRYKRIGSEIYENSAGIIGLGRLGRILAGYLSCFGAKVFYYDTDKSITGSLSAGRTKSIEDLIRRSRIVIICAGNNAKNRNLIGKRRIDLMKDKYFVNISRGELVDEEYLIEKIERGHFRGVALDVIKDEIGRRNLKRLVGLMASHNLIVTPHIGGVTFESMRKTEVFIADKLRARI